MGLASAAVIEIDLTTCQRQVVERKTRRIAGRRIGRRFEFFKNIVNVIASAAEVGERHDRRVYLNDINHWGQPQQRFKLCIDIDTFDAELGVNCVFLGNR